MLTHKQVEKERIVWAISSGKDKELLFTPECSQIALEKSWKEVWKKRGRDFDRLILMEQVHGGVVQRITGGSPEIISGVDGLITQTPGILLGSKTADCLPILFWDPVTMTIGAAHAGWRGLIAGIVEEMLKRLMSEFAVEPKNLRVLLGPAIGPCCYDVSMAKDNRVNDFKNRFGESVVRRDESKILLDLRAAAKTILHENMISNESILSVDDCTAHGVVDYPSFYARKSNNRFLTVVGIANL